MKKIAAILLFGMAVLSNPAMAACTQQSMVVNGKLTICTTCCNQAGYCHTTCS